MNRRDVLKWGSTVGVLGLGGGWIAKHEWEARDDHISPEDMAQTIQDDLADHDGLTQLAQDDITVTFDRVDRYEDGGDVYAATVDLPLRQDADATLCPDEPDGTAMYKLEPDALRTFNTVYDTTGDYNAAIQASHEDQLTAYTLHFMDDTGDVPIQLDAADTDDITQNGTGFDEDNQDQVAAFQDHYRAQFDPDCYDT